MIRETNNIDDIVLLWNEAFGDSREDIEFFQNKLQNGRCIAYYDGTNIASMLYLIDCNLNGKVNHYIYAACTLEKYRSKGYMTKLINYSIDNYGSVCLIPANTGLIEYYKNRSLVNEYSKNEIVFYEREELLSDYLFEGCSLETPLILSNKER